MTMLVTFFQDNNQQCLLLIQVSSISNKQSKFNNLLCYNLSNNSFIHMLPLKSSHTVTNPPSSCLKLQRNLQVKYHPISTRTVTILYSRKLVAIIILEAACKYLILEWKIISRSSCQFS